MTKQTEALKMAIKEIEGWIDHAYGHSPEECADNKTIMACKEALEQPTQEPVAWRAFLDSNPLQTKSVDSDELAYIKHNRMLTEMISRDHDTIMALKQELKMTQEQMAELRELLLKCQRKTS